MRNVLIAIVIVSATTFGGCVSSDSGVPEPSGPADEPPPSPGPSPTRCENPSNATVEFRQASGPAGVSVTVTARSITANDSILVQSSADDRHFYLNETNASVTIDGLTRRDSVGAYVDSCGVGRTVGSYSVAE